MAETIKLTSAIDGFEFSALHAQPKGERKGGVVLIQEIFGLDDYMVQDVARWQALGFEVIAPSMFDRQEYGFTADHDEEGFSKGIAYLGENGWDNPVSDVQACVDALKDKGPVFVIGYCYGGAVAWRVASLGRDVAAVSSYYGGHIAQDVDMEINCPIICHFGRKDAHIPADEISAKIKAAHPDIPVYIYENGGHGFNNDGRPDSDANDAQLARERTLELFKAHGAK